MVWAPETAPWIREPIAYSGAAGIFLVDDALVSDAIAVLRTGKGVLHVMYGAELTCSSFRVEPRYAW